MITAFLLIVCEPAAIADTGRRLSDVDGIQEVYSTTGSSDIIAVVRVENLETLATLVTEHVAALPGILGTDTHLAIRSYGRADEAAAFDIGVD